MRVVRCCDVGIMKKMVRELSFMDKDENKVEEHAMTLVVPRLRVEWR